MKSLTIICASFRGLFGTRGVACILGLVIVSASSLFFISCGKKQIVPEVPELPAPDESDKNQDESGEVESPTGDFILVGEGKGTLIIDGNTKKYTCNTHIRIKEGSYSNITIRNLTGKSGCPFVITNEGTVRFDGSGRTLFLEDLSYVEILGNSNSSLKYGFVFQNSRNEAIKISGAINHFTLSNARFDGINAYGVISYKPTLVYNGSEDSFLKDLHFLNLESEGSGTLIRFESQEGNRNIIGLIRGIEIAGVHFSKSPQVGSVIVLGKAEDVDLHNNLIEDINSSSSNHNGVFYIQGNGKFYNNIVRNHQGNAIRAWIFSIGNTPKEMLIYNNIVINSREYGAFELQAFDRDIIPGISTFANAKVFNNTCGDLKPKGGSFPAQIVDLYGLFGGECEIFNNIGYSFYRVGQNNTNYFWNQLGNTSPSKHSHNVYFDNYQQAGIVINDAKLLLSDGSPLKHAAEPFYLLTEDIYGNKRGSKPSIGAIE